MKNIGKIRARKKVLFKNITKRNFKKIIKTLIIKKSELINEKTFEEEFGIVSVSREKECKLLRRLH